LRTLEGSEPDKRFASLAGSGARRRGSAAIHQSGPMAPIWTCALLYRANSGFVASRECFRKVSLATRRLPESCGLDSDKT
ncbi:hypothetical protein RZS08_33290, partial [Arthrospira platensis SPKY1]|nr:hypothetical protein [Arthrospira platensis SPKY1]